MLKTENISRNLSKDLEKANDESDKWKRRIESVKEERDKLLTKLKEKPEPQIIYRDREPETEPEPRREDPRTARPAYQSSSADIAAGNGESNEEYWAAVLREKQRLKLR